MLYIAWMVILSDPGIRKTSFEILIFELPKVKNCISRLCTNSLGAPPPQHFLSVYFFSVSFCPCLPGPLGLDKLSPTPPPCPLTA